MRSHRLLSQRPIADFVFLHSAFSASSGQVQCQPCAAGFYQPNTGASACLRCSPGEYSLSNPSGITACSPSPAGSFVASDGAFQFTACPSGTYQPSTGSSFCISCNPGTAQASTGTLSCPSCGAGTYSSSAGQAVCTQCDVGKITTTTGLSVCVACSAGSYQSGADFTQCVACAVGKSQPLAQQLACTSCVAGTYGNATGLASCATCPVGSTSAAGASACTLCPAGSFSNTAGSAVCTACPPVRDNRQSTQRLCSRRTRAHVSLVGIFSFQGQYGSSAGASSCGTCAAGTFTSTSGATSCSSCPAGSESPSESVNKRELVVPNLLCASSTVLMVLRVRSLFPFVQWCGFLQPLQARLHQLGERHSLLPAVRFRDLAAAVEPDLLYSMRRLDLQRAARPSELLIVRARIRADHQRWAARTDGLHRMPAVRTRSDRRFRQQPLR
jgi:hypothetical protein